MWSGGHWYGCTLDFVLVVRGCIDVAARVWLEVGWVWTYILESNGVRIPQSDSVSRLLCTYIHIQLSSC